ncbi:MAG: hypothetical protein JO094_17410, partial [Hyphomicrobiales bacterium]|nr:hypothetical protein [Hyphomicrobiales bacterium]
MTAPDRGAAPHIVLASKGPSTHEALPDVTTTICKPAREKRSGFALQAVFPNEGGSSGEGTVPVQLYASGEDIAQAKKARLDSQFEREKLTGGVKGATRRRHEAEEAPFETAFTFAGCVTYFSYSGLIGQTGFLLNIYRPVSLWGQPDAYDGGSFDVSR